jgi:hypothetical protein
MRHRVLASLVLVLALASCGDDTNAPGGGDAAMSAVIDGDSWEAGEGLVSATRANGAIGIGGGDADGDILMGIGFPDGGTGTYTVGPVNPTNMSLTEGSSQWVASSLGGSGTVTVTALTATRVAGTFSFVAAPLPGGSASGTRTVTSGEFDLEF